MPNPFNPLDWVQSAQNWFRKTELSSGFRPYLIFLLLQLGFSLMIFTFFSALTPVITFVVRALYFTFSVFVLLFAVKAFQDPRFCRSERHVEQIRKYELMEEKGDPGPRVIDVTSSTTAISGPTTQLPTPGGSG